MSVDEKRTKIFSEGVLIALIPVISYWVTYLYEVHFFAFYGIPDYLINISLNDVLWVSFQMGFFFFVAWSMLNMFLMLIGWPNDFSQTLFYLMFIIFVIQFLFYYPKHLNKLTGTLYVLLLFVFAGYILPWIMKIFEQGDKTTTSVDKKPIVNEQKGLLKPTIMDLLVFKFGHGLPFLYLFLFIMYQMATTISDGMALTKSEYLVINSEPKMVVVKTYYDNFVCSGLILIPSKFKRVLFLFQLLNSRTPI